MSVMAASASVESLMVPPAGDEGDRGFLFELVDDDEEDLCIGIDFSRSTSTKHLNPLYINNIDMIINSSPRRSVVSVDKEISVDPISVKQSVPMAKTAPPPPGGGGDKALHRNSSMKKPPVAITISRRDSSNFKYPPPVPPPAAHSKSNKFLSCSLPSSASSSPLCGPLSSKNSKKWRNQNQGPAPPPLPPAISYLGRQRSSTVSPFSGNQDSASCLARSKSCGEGRASAPSDEFDILSRTLSDRKNNQQLHGDDDDAMSNTADCEEFEDDERTTYRKKGKEARNKPYEDNFKCGALSCLYLPGFGKGKPVRPRKQEEDEEEQRSEEERMPSKRNIVISRTVSLEKFECGSWSSSAMINEDRDDVDSTHYYDLPLELIKNSANDTDTPVATAFVFEREIKGVLKNSSSRRDQPPRNSVGSSSSRHVRFSTSNSPSTCITPRLRKAREDFNAYLEAQGV